MELVQEPSVIRRFIRLLQEPFSRIKQRWLSYFAHLAMDDDPSDASLDVEGQSKKGQSQDRKRDEPDNNFQKKNTKTQNHILSKGPSIHSSHNQEPEDGNDQERVYKEEEKKEGNSRERVYSEEQKKEGNSRERVYSEEQKEGNSRERAHTEEQKTEGNSRERAQNEEQKEGNSGERTYKEEQEKQGNNKERAKKEEQKKERNSGERTYKEEQEKQGNNKERGDKVEQKKEDSVELELENHEPRENKKLSQKNNPGRASPASGHSPSGHPRMMFKTTVTAMGATIGLGHLWRLPNMAYQMKTGSFVILYTILTLIFGFPLYFISLSCGQYTSHAALKLYERVPLLQGVGLSMILFGYVSAVYQMQMIGFGVHYLVSSFQLDLPWMKCDLTENGTTGSLCSVTNDYLRAGEVSVQCPLEVLIVEYDKLCSDDDPKYKYDFVEECCGSLKTPEDDSPFYNCQSNLYKNHCISLAPPSMHFWNVTVLRPFSDKDPPSGFLGTTNVKLLFCSLGTSLLVYGIVLMGFKRTVYISMFIIPLTFAAYIILVLSTLRMSGSADGLLKLIMPDLESLQNSDIWYAALEQCLYSLGLGMCLVVSLGSISPFNNATHKTALSVTFSVLIANLLSASLVYAMSGAAEFEWGKPFYGVFDAGLGTIYVVYSQALAQLPLPWLFSCIFYTLFAMTGACSLSGLMSSITLSISEIVHLTSRDMYVLNFIVVFSCFLLGIPITMRGGLDFIEALDTAAATFSGPTIIACEIITLFIYGFKFFCEDIAFMLGFNPLKWLLLVSFAFPFVVFSVLVFKLSEYHVPEWNIWARATGFGALGLILAPIALVFILRLLLPMSRGLHPISNLGPKSEQHKLEREEFKKKRKNNV